MFVALTIAGSDSSGGAGIQADLKTMTSNGVFGMSAITALTAQNTTGVQGIFDVAPEFVYKQIESCCTDIRPDAVKIGMVSNPEIIEAIEKAIKDFDLKNVVVDPVMVATSGSSLIKTEAVEMLSKKLFPLATLITPNIPESEILAEMKIENESEMEKAAMTMVGKFGCSVLVKGGHNVTDANDFLLEVGTALPPSRASGIGATGAAKGKWFFGKRIDNPNTHGTGCTLSSAIASNLAKGNDLETSVKNAKEYLSECLRKGLDLGNGRGPLQHF